MICWLLFAWLEKKVAEADTEMASSHSSVHLAIQYHFVVTLLWCLIVAMRCNEIQVKFQLMHCNNVCHGCLGVCVAFNSK